MTVVAFNLHVHGLHLIAVVMFTGYTEGTPYKTYITTYYNTPPIILPHRCFNYYCYPYRLEYIFLYGCGMLVADSENKLCID